MENHFIHQFKGMTLFVFGILIMFFLLPSISAAWEFDNVGKYDKETQTIAIKNSILGISWLDLDTIAEIQLTSPLSVSLPLGYYNFANITIRGFEDYNSFLTSMEFYDRKISESKFDNENKIERNFDIKIRGIEEYSENKYKLVCNTNLENTTNKCVKVISETILKERIIWRELTERDIKQGEVLDLELFTIVENADNVEWIPNFMGVRVSEWASFNATGGTITYDGDYQIHTFTTNGTFTIIGSGNIEVLVVAGGGGGGSKGGGAGAGGLNYSASYAISAGDYAVTVGLGGKGGTSNGNGTKGQDSSLGTLFIAEGGGFGGGRGSNAPAGSGGSGGSSGSSGGQYPGASGIIGQGNNGGENLASDAYTNGGGGGAGEVGSNANVTHAGDGGDGLNYSINGTSTYYSGGGGGGMYDGTSASIGLGGLGGGGNGGDPATAGTNGTGGGGGGGGGNGENIAGSDGGSGIVIIRFLPVGAAVPEVTLEKPDNNTRFTTTNINMNCTVSDEVNLINNSLILDGIVNETNSSGINNSLYNFEKTVSIDEHNWTCRGANNISGVTTADVRFFNINISVGTELISPVEAENITSTSTSLVFNSTPINQDLVFGNITIWHSNGTLLLTNSANLSGSSEVQTNITNSIGDGDYIWTADTTGTITTNTTVNRTFIVHATPTTITVTEPTGIFDGVIENSTFNLSWQVQEAGQNLSEHVVNCSYTYNEVQIYLDNISMCIEINTTTFTYVSGVNSLVFTAEDEFGLVTNETTTWEVVAFLNSQTFNSTTFETELNNFTINITYNESLWSSISANLIYNSTTHPTEISAGSGDSLNFSATISRLFVAPNTKPFFWNFQLTNTTGTFDFNTTNQSQTEQPIQFGLCNVTLTVPYLNISFKDEVNESLLLATIPTSTFVYTLGNFTINKTFSYINSSNNLNYAFCALPANRTYRIDPIVQYASSGYPQRTWNPESASYTNSSANTNQTLYLLGTSDGIFVTFQVVNPADQLQSGVDIIANRSIGGVETTVASGTTAGSGTVTFWLNPDFTHTITFAKTGFETFTFQEPPTQSSYTIILQGGVVTTGFDYSRGISYFIKPEDGELINNTIYNFNYTLFSSFWEVTEFGFDLLLENRTILVSTSASTSGGFVNVDFNVSNHSRIFMNYYYIINSTRTNFTTHTWHIIDQTYTAWSVKVFFTDLNLYLDSGIFGLDNFGRYLITFLILFLTIGIFSFKFGVNSPLILSAMTFAIIFFFDVVVGLVPTPINAIPHSLTFLALIILITFAIREGQVG